MNAPIDFFVFGEPPSDGRDPASRTADRTNRVPLSGPPPDDSGDEQASQASFTTSTGCANEFQLTIDARIAAEARLEQWAREHAGSFRRKYRLSPVDTDDLESELWIKGHTAMDRWNPQRGSIEPFIYTVMRNHALAFVKRRARALRRYGPLKHDVKDSTDHESIIEWEAGVDGKMAVVRRTLNQDEIAFMSMYADLGATDTAKMIGRSRSTVHRRASAIREKFDPP